MKNLKEFKELIRRYETINIEEIRKARKKSEYKDGHNVAQSLTGFGGNSFCTLCIAANDNCKDCVYSYNSEDWGYHCLNKINRPTYDGISKAKTPLKLLKGYRNRAEHLKTYYKEIL